MNSCTNQPVLILDLRPDLSKMTSEMTEPPAWISPEVWVLHRLDQNVAVTGGDDALLVLARRTSCSRKMSLFLWNETSQLVTVRVHAPGVKWMFTGQAMWAAEDTGLSGSTWRMEPSMPLPLPKEIALEPERLVMVQIADVTPIPDPPHVPEP
ncbi:MAG: hypothetical protein ACKV1O_28720 [Saprospiraceae bacterium]